MKQGKIRVKSKSLSSKARLQLSIMIFFIIANVITSAILSSKMKTQELNINNNDVRFMTTVQKAYQSYTTMNSTTLFYTTAPDIMGQGDGFRGVVGSINQSKIDLQNSMKELQLLAPNLNNTDQKDIAATIQAVDNFITFNDHIVNANQTDRKKGFEIAFGPELEKVYGPISGNIANLIHDAENDIKIHADKAYNLSKIQNLIVIIFGGINILLGLGIAYYIHRAINPLRGLTKKLKTVGEGNFTEEDIQVQSSDEIGEIAQAVNTMKNSLREVIEKVGLNAEQVAASSGELSASAEQTSATVKRISHVMSEVSAGSEEQARSTATGLHLIQEMAARLEEVSEHAQGSANSSEQATQIANQGQASIEQAMNQMNSINKTSQSLTVIVKELGTHSTEIGQIANAIQSISSQTNLLALNAAIEAARAGENGKGFAVVADEVRKLAEQSNHLTDQVLELVTTIQSKTVEAVQAAELTNKEMSDGIHSVNIANEAFDEINQSVSEVKQRIKQVALYTKEMSLQSSQIVESIQTVAEVASANSSNTKHVSSSTKEQLAAMEEITIAAVSLSSLSDELLKTISVFSIK